MATKSINNADTVLSGDAASDREGADRRTKQHPAPRTVIRGESLNTNPETEPESFYLTSDHKGNACIKYVVARQESSHPYAAITDWLNITFPLLDTAENIEGFFQSFLEIVGGVFSPVIDRQRGLHGWRRSYSLGSSKALFAIGGQHSKALLSLNGDACARVHHNAWPQIVDLLHEYKATITRWDGAVDDFEGHHSVDMAVELYKSGSFSTGGNKPMCKQHGNWIDPDGTGRTLDVGQRKNGKMIRIYEKGKQLGDTESPWVRWELELHNKDRVIPYDVLLNPGQYVAGSYKCLTWIQEETCRIKTLKNTAIINYDRLTKYTRLAYGKHINVMLKTEGSPEAVIDKLRRDGVPSRLELPLPAVAGDNITIADYVKSGSEKES